MPEALGRLNFIFFDDDAQFDDSLKQLCEALATDIAWIRKHTEYGEAARHWAASGRPAGLLLRSPVLEEAERWIASRPPDAPAPTEETQTFIAESRRGATKPRNILTGSLAAGLIIALLLAGLAYWQRGVALAERQHAIAALAAATRASNSLIYDIAEQLRTQTGVPSAVGEEIIGRAKKLQDELTASGQNSPDLEHSQASALSATALTLLSGGDRAGALDAADLRLHFLEIIAQRLSFLPIGRPFFALQDDVFNLSASLAKIKLLHETKKYQRWCLSIGDDRSRITAKCYRISRGSFGKRIM